MLRCVVLCCVVLCCVVLCCVGLCCVVLCCVGCVVMCRFAFQTTFFSLVTITLAVVNNETPFQAEQAVT